MAIKYKIKLLKAKVLKSYRTFAIQKSYGGRAFMFPFFSQNRIDVFSPSTIGTKFSILDIVGVVVMHPTSDKQVEQSTIMYVINVKVNENVRSE